MPQQLKVNTTIFYWQIASRNRQTINDNLNKAKIRINNPQVRLEPTYTLWNKQDSIKTEKIHQEPYKTYHNIQKQQQLSSTGKKHLDLAINIKQDQN